MRADPLLALTEALRMKSPLAGDQAGLYLQEPNLPSSGPFANFRSGQTWRAQRPVFVCTASRVSQRPRGPFVPAILLDRARCPAPQHSACTILERLPRVCSVDESPWSLRHDASPMRSSRTGKPEAPQLLRTFSQRAEPQTICADRTATAVTTVMDGPKFSVSFQILHLA